MAITPNYYTAQMPYYNQQQYIPQYMPQQSYALAPMAIPPQQNLQGVIFVDGEGAARATQIPDNWDKTKSLALWDMSAPYIYIRSFNQAGFPNPLMRLKYNIDDPQQDQNLLPAEQMSGDTAPNGTAYVTHEEMESLKNDISELKEMLKRNHENQNNANHGNNQNGQGRGGNR